MEEQDKLAKDLSQQSQKVAQKGAKATARAGAKLLKNAFKGVGKKVALKVGVALKGAIVKLAIATGWIGAIVVAFLLLVMLIYVFFFETRGEDQRYDYFTNNEAVDGILSIHDLADTNKLQVQFYQYFADNSFYQILDDDNTELVQTHGTDAIRDYYRKEEQFRLSPNLLFSLDDVIYRNNGAIKYPEQHVQHVKYNHETLELEMLTNDKGEMITNSTEYVQTQVEIDEEIKTVYEKTGNEIEGMHDYGLGSIYKYEEAERTIVSRGEYVYKDVWDSTCAEGQEENCGRVVQVEIEEEYELMLEDFPQYIHIMTKAITFVGEFAWEFEEIEEEYAPLVEEISKYTVYDDVADNKTQVYYDTYVQTIYYECEKTGTDAEGNEYTYMGTCSYEVEHELYKYRDGLLYETLPRPINDISRLIDRVYINDYLSNFSVYIPIDALSGVDFKNRVGTFIFSKIEVGSEIESRAYKDALKSKDEVELYASQYNIDKELIYAFLAHDDSFNIAEGAERLQNLLAMYDNDVLKAIQAYEFGVVAMDWMRDTYPQEWSTYSWMNQREEANRVMWTNSKNTLFIEEILPYLDSEELQALEEFGEEEAEKSWWDSLFNKEEAFEYEEYYSHFKLRRLSAFDNDSIFRMASALETQQLYSEAIQDVFFWDKDFYAVFGAEQMSYRQWQELTRGADYGMPFNLRNWRISSPYGMRADPFTGAMTGHRGIDVPMVISTPLHSIADGTVVFSGRNGGYGNVVIIEHDDRTRALYAHCDRLFVTAGERISRADVIAVSGNTGRSTGPHLHFEFHVGGVPIDPIFIMNN